MAYLIEKLNKDIWENVKDPSNETGFELYHIGRAHENKGNNVFHYAVRSAKGSRVIAVLEGSKGDTDPLKGVANCRLKLQDTIINGIDVDGDMVIRK